MTSIALNTFKKITLKQVLAPVLAITLVFSAPPIFASIASPAPSKQDVAEMKKIVGYYPEWGLYSGHKNYNPADMAINKMTHINYAFATIKNGEIAEFDTWAASGVTAQFGEAYNSEFKGALGQFKKLEAQFPQTSFMISIGGWTQSGGFHEVAATPQARQKFADSVVAFVRKWHFDGVDIDWEYPGVPRQPDKVDNTNDQGTPNADASERQTFTLLLKDLRAALDAAGQQDNTYYQLTAAVSANLPYIDLTDPAEYAQYLDFVNLMTYDLHGAWDGKTNHQSALFSNPQAGTAAYSVHNTVSYFLAKGVPAEKLIIGSPFYSRGWKGVSDASPISGLPGLFASANGGAAGIWDGGRAAGNNPYWKLKEMEQDPAFIKYYDEVAQAPYLYSQSKQEMYTYEDTQSLGAKVSYVVNNDLGGIIFWEVTGDAPLKGTELLDVIYNGFYAGVVPPAPVAPEPPAETGSGATGEAGDTNGDHSGDTDASSGDAGAAEAGAWNPEAVYNGGDKVRHNGQRYQAKWWTQGNEPGTEQWGPWEALAADTDMDTDTGAGGNEAGDVSEPTGGQGYESGSTDASDSAANRWQAGVAYVGGAQVFHNGQYYQAKWWTQGNEPGAEQWGPWEALGSQAPSGDVGSGTSDDQNGDSANDSGGNQSGGDASNDSGSESGVGSGGDDDSGFAGDSTWSATAVYTGGDLVRHNGRDYQAKWWTQGNEPGTEQWGPWEAVNSTGNDGGAANNGDVGQVGGGQAGVGDGSGNTGQDAGQDASPETGAQAGYAMTQAELTAREAALTDSPQMTLVKETIRTLDNTQVEAITPLRAENPANVKRVESLLSQAQFEYLFPKRVESYTYTNFLKAVGKFPAFCGDYSDGRDADQICRKSLANMFAHFAQETGGHAAESVLGVPEWRQALMYVREMGYTEQVRGAYAGECNPDTWQGQAWPCGTFDDGEFKSYFGRGAKQLSYNYNYGPFSQAMTGNVRTLLDNPELVADTWLNFASAVFFFTYPQTPKPSMLHILDGTWQPNAQDEANNRLPGFGVTTMVMNGGVECGGTAEHQQSANRIRYYQRFADYFGVPIPADEVLGCANMAFFDGEGSAAMNTYWDQDWGYDASKPGGQSYACKLVNYQTAYSAFVPGDYTRCVQKHFPDVQISVSID